MTYQLLLGPITGGVIGYFTNWLAIKMLFRPHRAVYVLGIHVPFTPGIIPKEKGRIAQAIGKAISENLINQDVLQRTLLSDEITGRIDAAVARFFDNLAQSDESLRDFLARYVSDDDIRTMTDTAKKDIGNQLQSCLATANVGDQIAHLAMEHVLEKMRLSEDKIIDSVPAGDKHGIGDFVRRGIDMMLGNNARRIFAEMINSLAAPVESLLAKNINEIMQQHAAGMTQNIVAREADHLLDSSMADLLSGKQQQLQQLRQSLLAIYKDVITQRLPHMLQTINISRMIQDRINEMDMDEAEHIILDVMDNELRWLVWLGAILGFVIGFANTLSILI